jgi:hypothetical protein
MFGDVKMHTKFYLKNLNTPLEGLRYGWENNIKTGLKEIRCVNVDWINLAEDGGQWPPLSYTIMNFRVP